MSELATIIIRSTEAKTRHIGLVDDACQCCHRIGMVLHFDQEDWRICLDCLSRYFTQWTITSFPIPQAARDLANPNIPTLFADNGQQTGLDPVERAIIRQAVSDHAATFHGGVLGLGEFDAARYTAETYVHTQINDRREEIGQQRLTVAESIDLTDEEIGRQPNVLHNLVTDDMRKTRLEQRTALAEQLIRAARDACRADRYDQATALIDLAEATAPLTLIGSGYDHYRSIITRSQTNAKK